MDINIQGHIKKLGYESLKPDMPHIKTWLSWYMGKVSSFHAYYQFNGKKKIRRERLTLGMAKNICEDWANLLLNEKVSITCDNENDTKTVNKVLYDNNFRVEGNRLIETSFALGTGAFVEYKDGERIAIDYIPAHMIHPISWDNGIITECAFGSEKIIDGKKCIYLQLHVLEKGNYVIKNRLYSSETGIEIPLPENVRADFNTRSSSPLFQIIKPNIVNNIDLESPMGISVYANAIDMLKGVDLVFDSYINEFRLGKKRVIVPVGMAQIVSNNSTMTPIFDDNDTEFYAFPSDTKDLNSLKEVNMSIRSQEHTEGLNKVLSLLSDKCGLGNDRYKFDNASVKTATEVISENSTLYQNMKKHEIIIEKALQDLAKAILILNGSTKETEVIINFDDSIIQDTDAQRLQDRQDVSSGIMAKWEYRHKYYNETEEESKRSIAEIDSDFYSEE